MLIRLVYLTWLYLSGKREVRRLCVRAEHERARRKTPARDEWGRSFIRIAGVCLSAEAISHMPKSVCNHVVGEKLS
jgi:hypothetical protein